jgi:hypothetical protein
LSNRNHSAAEEKCKSFGPISNERKLSKQLIYLSEVVNTALGKYRIIFGRGIHAGIVREKTKWQTMSQMEATFLSILSHSALFNKWITG